MQSMRMFGVPCLSIFEIVSQRQCIHMNLARSDSDREQSELILTAPQAYLSELILSVVLDKRLGMVCI